MKFKKGFTLIELLVVIGVLAVIAAGVVALIDPVDKNRAAQDAKVQSDIGQIATALQANVAASTTGVYPATLAALATLGELTSLPTPPTGYCGTYNYTGGGTAAVTVGCNLRSNRYTRATPATPFWVWCSSTGRAGPSTALTTCP